MKKNYLILSLLLITGIAFSQNARKQSEPLRKSNEIVSSSNKEVEVLDITCDENSLFGNDLVFTQAAVLSDAGEVAATDFATTGGEIETLKFWGITAYDDGAWGPCDESNPITFDINFYADYDALQAGTPSVSFDDITITATETGEMFYNVYPLYEWNVTLPSSVSLTTGIIAINADTVGTANAEDCWFMWVSSLSGYGNSYTYDGSWITSSDRLTICMGEALTGCYLPIGLTSSNITNVSAEVSWLEVGPATAWEYEYVVSGTIPTGTGTSVTSTTASLTGLIASTTYDFYIRTDCGDGTYSDWSEVYTFETTACEPENQCDYEFILNDSWGYGAWDGAFISVIQDGVEIAQVANNIVGTSGNPTTETVSLAICTDSYIEFVWNSGDYDYQNSFVVNNSFGNEILSITDGSTLTDGETFYTFTSSCTPVTCPSPTTLSASDITLTSAVLSWTEAGTATAWNIEYGVAGFIPTETGTAIAENTYTINGLTEATSYEFYVQADCGGGDNSAWVGPFDFSTSSICLAPTGLSASDITTTSAILSWIEAGTATAWNIEYGVAGFIPTETGTAVAENSYTVNGLAEGTSYEFYVQADCGGYNSTWVGPFAFSTLSSICLAPTDLSVSDITTTSAILSWIEAGTATVWNIEYGVAGFTPTETGTAVAENSYTVNGLTEATSYEFYVQADCGGGNNSTWVGPFIFITDIVDDINTASTDKVNIFPNPTTGIINIVNAENNTVVVYNMIGQVVTSVTNAQSVDMSGLENGTYFVKVVSENETITKKVNLIK